MSSRVTINGESFDVPFERLFRALTPDEFDGLSSDVFVNGVLNDVLWAVTPLRGRVIVDGAHRARAGERTGREVPMRYLGEMSDADARALCLSLNTHRRQLAASDYATFRPQAIAEAVRLKREGKSYRYIQRETGVPRSTVAGRLAAEAADGDDAPPPRKAARAADAPPPRVMSFPGLDDAALEADAARDALGRIAAVLRGAATLESAAAELLAGPMREAFIDVSERCGCPVKGEAWSLVLRMRELQAELAALGDDGRAAA